MLYSIHTLIKEVSIEHTPRIIYFNIFNVIGWRGIFYWTKHNISVPVWLYYFWFTALGERKDIHHMMYETFPNTAMCFRILNGTNQFGCSSKNWEKLTNKYCFIYIWHLSLVGIKEMDFLISGWQILKNLGYFGTRQNKPKYYINNFLSWQLSYKINCLLPPYDSHSYTQQITICNC